MSNIILYLANFFIFIFYVYMRISFQQNVYNNINIPRNRRITFCSTNISAKPDVFIRSNDDWIELRNLLNKKDFEYPYVGPSVNEQRIIKKAVPCLDKLRFTKQDFDNLSKKERLILDNLINKEKELEALSRNDISISKDAERILFISKIAKERLDKKYPNGYTLISVGNSPAPFVETMKLFGADAFVMPFSRNLLYAGFPFILPTHGNNTKRYNKETWIKYFNYFNLNPDIIKKTGKEIIFTDYYVSGETLDMCLKPILKNLNYPENVKVVDIFQIFGKLREHPDADKILGKFNLSLVIDFLDYKKYSATLSAKNMNFNVFLNPELIETTEQPFNSKLLRYALWKLMK